MNDFIFKQYINGEWVEAKLGGTWSLVNPADEAVIGALPFGGMDDARAALDFASAAFPAWSRTTAYERAEILLAAADWITARIEALARVTTEESGKPLGESRAEWRAAPAFLRWFAGEAQRAYGRTIPSSAADRRVTVIRQPVGVVGTITAWNFPVYNVVRAWGAALAAGCTIVGRPSEYTPRSAMLLAQAFHEAGVPPGVLNLVTGDPATISQVMLDDPRCRKISFTGSIRTGQLLMEGAAQSITRLLLELEGNAPAIIFPDVPDVEAVARQAVNAKYGGFDHISIPPQRFYVHESIATEFTDHVTRFSEAVPIGSGHDSSPAVGPLINPVQLERLEKLVEDAQADGAALLTGGERPTEPSSGYFYRPTVLADITTEMGIYHQEIFGPVIPIMAFADIDEVLALANATEYGLAAYVQTGSLNTAIQMYEELEYGMVAVNDWLLALPEAPFGGIKQSGIGRESGLEGLDSYLEAKTVVIGGLDRSR